MENILEKIKEYRKKKGYSYETMAHELNTSSSAYRKIELNQTKLTVEKLQKIAIILEAKIEDLLEIKADAEFKQTNNENSTGYQQQIEHFYQENKEKADKIEQLYESRLKDKDEIINHLKVLLDKNSK